MKKTESLDAKLNLSRISSLTPKDLFNLLPVLSKHLPPVIKVMADIEHSYVWVGDRLFVLGNASDAWLGHAFVRSH